MSRGSPTNNLVDEPVLHLVDFSLVLRCMWLVAPGEDK